MSRVILWLNNYEKCFKISPDLFLSRWLETIYRGAVLLRGGKAVIILTYITNVVDLSPDNQSNQVQVAQVGSSLKRTISAAATDK